MERETMLKELASLCGQRGAADDLRYHLSTRFAANKVPTLLLLPPACDRNPAVDGIGAAVLLFEYTIFGIRSRVYATSDSTGRRTVIGPEQNRASIAADACRSLVALGAGIVLLSLREQSAGTVREAFEHVLGHGSKSGTWSVVEREAFLYLPLTGTYDETLASIGRRPGPTCDITAVAPKRTWAAPSFPRLS